MTNDLKYFFNEGIKILEKKSLGEKNLTTVFFKDLK